MLWMPLAQWSDSPAAPAHPLLFPRAFLCQKHSVSICSAAINQRDAHTSTGQPCAPWDQGAARCLRQCSAPERGSFIPVCPQLGGVPAGSSLNSLGCLGPLGPEQSNQGPLCTHVQSPGSPGLAGSDTGAAALAVDKEVPCPWTMSVCPRSSCSKPGKEPGRSSQNPCPL